jgi:hypothetical protein
MTFGAANLDIVDPTVEIVDFVMYPHGKGFGTEVIKSLINFIESNKWGFEIMMLKAQDLRAALFWRKVGVKEVDGYQTYTHSMTRPLNKLIKENKMRIKLSYKKYSVCDKIVLQDYNIKWKV